MKISQEILDLKDEMIEMRRDFHRHPELGLHEVRTSGIVEQRLKDLGYQVRRCSDTGVIGVLKGGKPGKTILLRCDEDALPVAEETGLPFASENPGVMHACGHDGHLTIHLTTAKLLARHKDEIPGTVVMLFQKNEEDAGAQLMIDDGALDDNPDAVCGFHLWSPIPTGKIGVVPGAIMASSWYFYLTIHGKGGHGGAPHTAISPILVAAKVIEAAEYMVSSEISALTPTTIAFGQIHGGDKDIIIPDEVRLAGSIRCLHDGDEAVRKRFAELCEKICEAYHCTCDISFKCGNSTLMNDPDMTKILIDAASDVIGRENILTEGVSTMIGDDFAEFSHQRPGVYYFIGTRSKKAGSIYEHHSSHFTIDEDSLPIAVQIQMNLVRKYLGF